MDPLLLGFLAIGALLALIGIGVPVAFAMASVAIVGMTLSTGLTFALGTVRNLPYHLSSQYAFAVIPMFVLMGAITFRGGITTDLYTAAHRFLGRVRGSLYYATVLAAAGFAAVSGSTVVAAAVFTRIALPEMLRLGFSRGLSAGCIAGAGTFAAMIPPSITMVVYGIITGESIGALLIAGILPGILTVAVYVVGLQITLRLRPDWAPLTAETFTWSERLQALAQIWPFLILVLLVIGGIYSGSMPPSAAGAVGAAGALAICLLRRRIGGAALWEALRQSAGTTTVIFMIMIGGLLLSRMLLGIGFVDSLTSLIRSVDLSPAVFILAIVVLYFILGMFIDALSMMIMTIPFLYPIVKTLELDPIWFGIIVVKLVEIAVITPPVGLNLYAVLGASEGKVKAADILWGIWPFVVFELVTLALLCLFPAISTWLPRQMIG